MARLCTILQLFNSFLKTTVCRIAKSLINVISMKFNTFCYNCRT